MDEKIIIHKTGYLVWMSRLTLILLAVVLAYLAYSYPELPDQLPSHFGLSGKADAWEPKSSIWIFEGIGIGIYLLLTIVLRFPGIWNTGVTVTRKNKEWVYQSLAAVLVTMRFFQVCLFAYITWRIMRGENLNGTILSLLILGLLAPLAVYLIRSRKHK